jgi:DNA repair photolyase
LYENIVDYEHAVERWLRNPKRRKPHMLGLGIDRSDSLLYEGIAPYVRSLAPFFGSTTLNPHGNKLILLTNTTNTHYLADIHPDCRSFIIVSFSLNPEMIADLWEGKWADGERITPSVARRLEAACYAQDLGFEVRARIDPILTPEKWEDHYAQFIADVQSAGIHFHSWTLGTYREKNMQLDAWRERWGLPSMEWQPDDDELLKDGTHRHLPESRRVDIYRTVQGLIAQTFAESRVSLCKETHVVRRAVGLCNAYCNCLR